MNKSLVVSVMGPNTHGLVHRLAEIAVEFDASWLGARMANLAGQFAGVLELEVPLANADKLDAALHCLEAQGLRIMTTYGTPHDAAEMRRLELVCQDHIGIVRGISGVLAQHGVSIEELLTDRVSGPFSGEQMFRAEAQLRVPEQLPIAQLRDALESLANELVVDLTLDDRRIR